MSKKAEVKKGFRMPHVFIILLAIMLLIVVLSYLIPSGSYERIEDSATGMTVIDPDTFSYVENETPITFMDYFEAVYTGFVNGATIMGTLFISSGVIYLLEVSGAFGASWGTERRLIRSIPSRSRSVSLSDMTEWWAPVSPSSAAPWDSHPVL